MSVTAKANQNFSSLTSSSVHDIDSPEYIEYRRCWEEYPANFVVRDFPLHLDIESTNRCNLRCTFCDKLPVMRKNQIGDMNFDLYKKIIDEGSEKGLYGVKLSYRGESLLHKKISEMVSYAKNKGIIDVYFNSNGMLLSEDMSLRLLDAGLDRISISIEGTDPISFEKERRGAKFSTIKNNIINLIELRNRKQSSCPKVRIQTVALPGLDLESYKKYWAAYCDEVAAIDYKDASARNVNINDSDWACPQLWQRMTIEWDGTIMPCNNDDLRSLSPGNVNEKSVEDCWHAAVVEKARALHRNGQSHLLASCDGCPWRTTQLLKKSTA